MTYGKPVIYKVKSKEMYQDGYKFFCSVNGVWLTKAVPVRYIEISGKLSFSYNEDRKKNFSN